MLAIAIARWLSVNVDGLAFDEAGADGNVFIAAMPSTPDVALAVVPTGGYPQPTLAPTDLPTVQLLVRGDQHDPRGGLDLAERIYGALTCLDLVDLDEHRVIGCTALQSAPVALGLDSNRRHEWSLNFAFRVHAPTLHRQGAAS